MIGRGAAADADHWLAGQALHEFDIGLLVALLGEARGDAVVLPGADIDVPEVGQLGEHGDDVASLAGAGDAVRPEQLVDGEPHGHRAGVADGVLGFLDQLAQQPAAIGETAAVFIVAEVRKRRIKFVNQIAVSAVDLDHLEASGERAARRGGERFHDNRDRRS